MLKTVGSELFALSRVTRPAATAVKIGTYCSHEQCAALVRGLHSDSQRSTDRFSLSAIRYKPACLRIHAYVDVAFITLTDTVSRVALLEALLLYLLASMYFIVIDWCMDARIYHQWQCTTSPERRAATLEVALPALADKNM